MQNPTGRIERGQPLGSAISARAWNRAQDAADIVFGQRAQLTAQPPEFVAAPYTWIICQNNSGRDIERFGILKITGFETAAGYSPFLNFPVITGGVPDENTGHRFCVALEPIPADKFGRVAVDGVVQCKIDWGGIEEELPRFAVAKDESTTELLAQQDGGVPIVFRDDGILPRWSLIRMGSFDQLRMRICLVEDDWPNTSDKRTLPVYEKVNEAGQSYASTGIELEKVVNGLFAIRGGSFVEVHKSWNGFWYVGAVISGALPGCGPTIGGEDVAKFENYDGSKVQVLGHEAGGCLKWLDVTTCDSSGGSG